MLATTGPDILLTVPPDGGDADVSASDSAEEERLPWCAPHFVLGFYRPWQLERSYARGTTCKPSLYVRPVCVCACVRACVRACVCVVLPRSAEAVLELPLTCDFA